MTERRHRPPGREADVVVGIDFGGTKVALAVAAPDGRILRSRRLDTAARHGAEQAVERAIAAAAELVEAAGGRCVGAGAVSPGIVHDDHIALAPNVPGWEKLALPRLIRRGLGVDTVVCGNDVKAAGTAEARWGALRGADPGLFLSLGTGIAAALVVGGRVLTGAHGAAGEIGYLLRDVTDVAGARSGRAPLEEYVSGSGLARRGARLLGGRPTAAELFAAADPNAVMLVDDALDALAVQAANIAITLDPQRVAVGGGLMTSAGRVLAALDRRLRESVPFPPSLVPARFVQDAALHGALALVLERL